MRIGFTGTRRGMSIRQLAQFRSFLSFIRVTEFHHGMAEGADLQAEMAILEELVDAFRVHRHPAGNDPLARNRVIVQKSDVLIAAPFENHEIVRSGTWATVRYAREAGIPVLMLSR